MFSQCNYIDFLKLQYQSLRRAETSYVHWTSSFITLHESRKKNYISETNGNGRHFTSASKSELH
jgi:hypothetical protein